MVQQDWLNRARLARSFRCAFRGVAAAYRQEQSFRLQCLFCFGVLVACLLVKPPSFTLVVLGLSCSLLLSAELFNSAVERLVDLVVGEVQHPLARAAKDLSAAAVLAVSWSVGVGCAVMLYTSEGEGSPLGALAAGFAGWAVQLSFRSRVG